MGRIFDCFDQSINYLLFFSAALAMRSFGDSIKPFFFKVRSAEVEILHLTFWPLMIRVRLLTFGLKTLRVWRCEKETLWPYILPLPVISQIAILFLLHCSYDCFERFFVVDGEISEDLAIKIDVLGFHTSDKLRVGKTKFARSIVDSGNP